MKWYTYALWLIALALPANAQVFDDESLFLAALTNSTIIDTSNFIGNTTFGISPAVAGADFFGPDAEVRSDDLILNGSGFHGLSTPHVGLNFSPAVNAVGVTSNPVDGGRIQLYSGPNGTGTLLSETDFGGTNSFQFTGVITTSDIGSVVFTCDFNQDLACGLRDPMFGTASALVDSDGDGVDDSVDNCLLAPNPSQVDSDSDSFGNACDADFNNDGITNFLDLVLLSPAFLSTDPVFDLNADGVVNFLDIALFSGLFLTAPGPGATG
ncbi:MAG: thrombospondin type 3 repeat-containing protein [Pseudomonadota bacterium]